MLKHQQLSPWYPIVRRWAAVFLITTTVLGVLAARDANAQKRQNTSGVALDGSTRFLFFNLTQAGSYDILKNGSAFDSRTVSPSGTLTFEDVTTVGDQFILTLTGVEPVTPSAPSDFTAAGTSVGCVDLSWANPPATEYVSDYVLLWGTQSGVYSDSMTIGGLSILRRGSTVGYKACGFRDGTYYFALRAHNQFGLWSGLSQEASALVTNGDTQAPAAPQNVAASEISFGCAEVTWDASGDPTVTGYVIYWSVLSVAGGAAADYSDSTIVGNAASGQVCGFAAGYRYFAVKAYTAEGLMSAYSQEVSVNMVGTDLAAPTFTYFNPPDGSTYVPLNVPILVALEDDKTGINPGSIVLALNGVVLTGLVITGTGKNYMVSYNPAGDMPQNTLMTVVVSAADNATPPNIATDSWTFETGDSSVMDTTAPVFTLLTPANGSSGVSEDAPIEVTITDDIMGVDPSSVVMYVNGVEVPVTFSGEFTNMTVRYENESGFVTSGRVDVRVEACDLSLMVNCATLENYYFTIAQEYYIALPSGAIVPDGFWANDPHKPLEVRNLPLAWTVRIYDAAGTPVRNFKNTIGDGLDWTWDFANNHGRRVARAIYLVRVTDGDGKVKQTGRFLVQTDP